MILGVDVSRYQPEVDWALLRRQGIKFVIVKATQGNYTTDKMLRTHVEGARKEGFTVGLYHWCDPLVGDTSQAQYFLDQTADIDYDFVCADAEQQWADWQEWANNAITTFLAPERISQNAHNILEYWRVRGKRVVLYTRTSFMNSYARPMIAWAKDYALWLAHYPYGSGRITTTWEDFKANYKPSIPGPTMPSGYAANAWTFWQFTGDVFVLPGTDTAWDINYFNGDQAELEIFAAREVIPTPEPEEEPPMAFETNAQAIQLDDRHTSVSIPAGKINAVVVDLGKGTARALRHTSHMDAAQAAGVPCLGVYEIDPELARTWDFDNEERWPVGLEDPHLKVLDRQIYSGGEPRYIHGIILSFKKYKQADGTLVTAGWQYMLMQHYMKTVFQYFKGKQQVYLMVDKNLVDQYPGTNQLTNYLAHQSYASTYQSAFLDDPANVTLPNWDAIPRPDITDRPGQPYAPAWQWWKYSNTKFYLPGVLGGYVPLWLFYRSTAELYGELGFTPGTVTPGDPPVTPPVVPPVVPPTTSVDLSEMMVEVKAIHALQLQQVQLLEKIAGVFN